MPGKKGIKLEIQNQRLTSKTELATPCENGVCEGQALESITGPRRKAVHAGWATIVFKRD